MVSRILNLFSFSAAASADPLTTQPSRESSDWAAELIKAGGTVPERFFELL